MVFPYGHSTHFPSVWFCNFDPCAVVLLLIYTNPDRADREFIDWNGTWREFGGRRKMHANAFIPGFHTNPERASVRPGGRSYSVHVPYAAEPATLSRTKAEPLVVRRAEKLGGSADFTGLALPEVFAHGSSISRFTRSGSGTVGKVAIALGRRAILCDLAYQDLALKRTLSVQFCLNLLNTPRLSRMEGVSGC